jgi:hypothetical protein
MVRRYWNDPSHENELNMIAAMDESHFILSQVMKDIPAWIHSISKDVGGLN